MWTKSIDTTKPDILVTINFTTNTPQFGSIVAVTPIPYAGVEAHHVGLLADRRTMVVGGLFAVRKSLPDLYFFDVATDPARPSYQAALDAPEASFVDDAIPIPAADPVNGGGLLVSGMGDGSGSTPGRLIELYPNLTVKDHHAGATAAHPDFNPHGLAADWAVRRIATADLADPATFFKPFTKTKYRSTARIWDADTRQVLKVVDLGPDYANGLMRAVSAGSGIFYFNNGLGDVVAVNALDNSTQGTIIWDAFPEHKPTGSCIITPPFVRNGARRLLGTILNTGWVLLFDGSNPLKLQLIFQMKLPNKETPPVSTHFCLYEVAQGQQCGGLSGAPSDVDNPAAERWRGYCCSAEHYCHVESANKSVCKPYPTPKFSGAGPHAIQVVPGANQFIVTNYYLDIDSYEGNIQAKSDNKLHIFNIAPDGNSFSHNREVDFNTELEAFGYPAGGRPHGFVVRAV